MKVILLKNSIRFVYVDDEDFAELNKINWFLDENGYARKTNFLDSRMHHDLMGGVLSNRFVIDHIDRNKLNNQKHNLRYVPKQINCLNNKKRYLPGYGITKLKFSYHVIVTRNYKKLSLGKYPTLEQAIIVRDNFLQEENLKYGI